MGFAEVSLTLENTQGTIPVDYTEVTITRRVYRSGESEYYINRSPCRLKDITELFMDTGVGKEGYSIIGQGRIDGILSSQPENRRQIFEEAAGIVKYKSRKQESERKLERVEENIIRINDILREISYQLGPLEEQSKAAREYLDLRDKLKYYELNRFIIEYDNYRERINRIKNNVALLNQDISNHRSNIQKLETENQDLDNRITVLDEIIQNLSHDRYKKSNEIERLKGKIQVIKERVSQLDRERSRLVKEIAVEAHSISEKKKVRIDILRELEEKKKSQESILQKSAKLNAELEKIHKELTLYHQDVQQKKDKVMDIWNALSDAKNTITKYRTLKGNLEEQRLQTSIRMEELNENRTALKQRITANTKHFEKLLDAEKSKKHEKFTLEQRIASLEQELATLGDKLQLQRQQLEGYKSKLKLLVDMAKTYDGFQKPLEYIGSMSNDSMLERKFVVS